MKKSFLVLFNIFILSFFINSCSEKEIHNAKVIDSTIEGLEYQCAGFIKYTPQDGSIKCYHLPLGFKVGEIKIGIIYEIPIDGLIFPQDMVGVERTNFSNENVQKLTILLQSIDSDNNASNGITITEETRKKLNDFIDLKEISIAELQDYLTVKLNKTLTSRKEALTHLYQSMREYNALPKSFTIQELGE